MKLLIIPQASISLLCSVSADLLSSIGVLIKGAEVGQLRLDGGAGGAN